MPVNMGEEIEGRIGELEATLERIIAITVTMGETLKYLTGIAEDYADHVLYHPHSPGLGTSRQGLDGECSDRCRCADSRSPQSAI